MKTLFLHYVCECRHQVKTALVFSPSEWPDSPHAFSSLFTPPLSTHFLPLPRTACGTSPTSPEKHYLFIITAASQQ